MVPIEERSDISRLVCIMKWSSLFLLAVLRLGLLLGFGTGFSCLYGQSLAFPGAEGFGAYAAGGRDGDVYVVTNTNSTGPGSFYEGVTTVPSNGRTIVFAVSGQIELSGTGVTRITSGRVTIAGQSAPGGGILLKGGTLRVSGDDIIIRHMRFRHGKNGAGGDCINLDGGCANAILDHVSMQFGTDSNMSSHGSPADNLTLQWSLNNWGLESRSSGGLLDQSHVTCHHTLWSHNRTRNPKAQADAVLEWTNNVTFDWNSGLMMGDSHTPAAWKANVINNYFVCPPGNIRTTPLEKGWLDRNASRRPNFTVHVSGNLHDNDGDGLLDGIDRGYDIAQGQEFDINEVVPAYATNPDVPRYYRSAVPIAGSNQLVVEDPLLAFKKIVSSSGALRLDWGFAGPLRDEVDARAITNLVSQTANHIAQEGNLAGVGNSGFGTFAASTAPIDTDQDGMPDLYENAIGWDAGTQDHNGVVSGDSYFGAGYYGVYRRLEEFLHFKACPHLMLVKGAVTNPDINLAHYTQGFSKSPVFTISNVTGGSAVLSGSLVHFTAQATPGRGGFDFNVTDAEGSSWTQHFCICVTDGGQPREVVWQGNGTGTAEWDTTSPNWKDGLTTTAFITGDRVTFDPGGAVSATVNLPSNVMGSEMMVNAPASFTFSGAGSVSTTGSLIKRGSGTVTFNNASSNSFAGGISLEEGTLAVNGAGVAGSSPIVCRGGHLSLGPVANSTLASRLVFDVPTTISVMSGHTTSGEWIGEDQTVTLAGNGSLWTVTGTWGGFTGRIQFGGSSTRMQMNGGTNTNFGSPAVAIDLGSANGQLMNGNGMTITLGSIDSAGAGTVLAGTQNSGVATTYSVGALHTDATFAGSITDGAYPASPAATNITKVGAGTWTLTGQSLHSGATLVDGGAMMVNGSFLVSPVRSAASAVSVNSGAALGGNGSIAGVTTVNSGGTLVPGASPGAVGTFTAGGGLELTGTTVLKMDLSSTPAAGNDKIIVSSGNLTLNGATVNFTVNLIDGRLGAGTYALIDGGATMAANPVPTLNLVGLPVGTRQTFTLQRAADGSSPAYVNLVVAGSPAAELTWTGAGGSNWNVNTTGNFTGGPTPTFFNFDSVLFDDTSSVGSVTLAGGLQPRNLVVDNSVRAYTFSGNGSITCAGSFIKSGSASLTFTPGTVNVLTSRLAGSNKVSVSVGAAAGLYVGMAVVGPDPPFGTYITEINKTNGVITLSQVVAGTGTGTLTYEARHSFPGGVFLNGGSIVLSNAVANRWALGAGPITFNGGTLSLAGVTGANTVDTGAFLNDFNVPSGQSGTLNFMQRGRQRGSLTGGGTFTVVVKYNRGDFYGDWSGFTGQLNIAAAQSGSEFRMAEDYAPKGFPNASVVLGDSVTLKHVGVVSAGPGTIIRIGQLDGSTGSSLQGGVTAGRALTYRIGGSNTSATFAGSITEQTPGTTFTNIVKTGSGTWTISGTNVWSGGTIIEAGTLCISGSTESSGAVHVQAGASLCLQNGTLTTDAVHLADGSTLTGNGTISGDLNIHGSAVVMSASGGKLTIIGEIVNDGIMRIAGNTGFEAARSFTNNGVLDLLTSASDLPVHFINNGVVIENRHRVITHAAKSGDEFSCSCIGYAGHFYQLQHSETLDGIWINVGAPVSGEGTTINWSVTNGGAGSRRFFRILVTP